MPRGKNQCILPYLEENHHNLSESEHDSLTLEIIRDPRILPHVKCNRFYTNIPLREEPGAPAWGQIDLVAYSNRNLFFIEAQLVDRDWALSMKGLLAEAAIKLERACDFMGRRFGVEPTSNYLVMGIRGTDRIETYDTFRMLETLRRIKQKDEREARESRLREQRAS